MKLKKVYLENLINNENSNKETKIVNEGKYSQLRLINRGDKIKQISKSINVKADLVIESLKR